MFPRASARGFTLVELLIALSITAATVGLAFATYATVGRTAQRAQDALARVERMRAVHDWLQRTLEGTRVVARVENGAVVQFFNGNAAGALWVSALPEPVGGAGVHVVRVGLDRRTDGRIDWIAQALPYDGALTHLQWEGARPATLLEGLHTLQWFYQDGVTGEWVQDWPSHQNRYPARIRIEVADGEGVWPPLWFVLPRAR